MSWSKLDDGFHEHPKTVAMSDKAFRLYVCGITYSSRHNLRGRLTRLHVAVLLRLTAATESEVSELESLSAWDADGMEYLIHGFDEYNPDNEEISRKRAEAGRIGGVHSGQSRSKRSKNEAFASEANEANAKQNEAKGIPYPNPLPNKTLLVRDFTEESNTVCKTKDCAADAACLRAFEQFWQAYPRKEGKIAARKCWTARRPGPSLVKEIAEGLRRAKETRQWQEGVIPHPATWLRGARWQDEPFTANGSAARQNAPNAERKISPSDRAAARIVEAGKVKTNDH